MEKTVPAAPAPVIEHATAPQRRRLRFSLRALFLAVTIVGGWLGYHLNWIRERHAFLSQPHVTTTLIPAHRAPLALSMMGEPGKTTVVVQCDWESSKLSSYEEAQVALARRLFPEAAVKVSMPTVNFEDVFWEPPAP